MVVGLLPHRQLYVVCYVRLLPLITPHSLLEHLLPSSTRTIGKALLASASCFPHKRWSLLLQTLESLSLLRNRRLDVHAELGPVLIYTSAPLYRDCIMQWCTCDRAMIIILKIKRA